jgi:hypothetical protein
MLHEILSRESFNGKKPFQMQETQFQDRGNSAVIAEKAQKLCGKFHFKIRKYSTKFDFKVRKPHFKLRKALLKGD